MELVLPMYNAHPYFSLKNVGERICTLFCIIIIYTAKYSYY